MKHLDDQTDLEFKQAYIVATMDGDILTNVQNPHDLKWTQPALFEDTGDTAVLFRGPHQIPARIAAQLTPAHQIFKVKVPVDDRRADFEAVLEADFVGPYTPLQRPDMLSQGASENHLWSRADRIR